MAKLVRRCWCCWECATLSETAAIRMAMVCTLQGLLWSSFSVFFLAVQTCAIQFECLANINIRGSGNQYIYVLNLISIAYMNVTGNNCSQHQDVVMVKIDTADRTYNLLIIHGLLNAVWIPLCVLLIVGLLSSLRGCVAVTLIYTPWLLVTFTVVLFDLVAASFYVADMDHARNLNSFLAFIRVSTTTDEIIPPTARWDAYTLYAPLFLALYFTRGVILTVFNMVTFVYILALMIRMCQERRFIPLNGLLLDGYDEIYSPILSGEVENIPLQAFKSAQPKAKSNLYESDLGYYNSKAVSKTGPATRHTYQSSLSREPSVHDYLVLLSSQTPVYQHIYEDIWRDVKKERLSYETNGDRPYCNGGNTPVSSVTPASPVYDYLGRPVLECTLTTEPSQTGINSEVSSRSRLDPCQVIEVSPRKATIPFVRSDVPPALPPCNKTKSVDSSTTLPKISANSPYIEYYETLINPLYEKTNFSYECTERPLENPCEDSIKELYSAIKKRPGGQKNLSFKDCDDSAYNSCSSATNCSKGVQTCSDYMENSKYSSTKNCGSRTNNSRSEVKNSDSGNNSICSVNNFSISHESSDSNTSYPEPPDVSKLPASPNEQTRKKKNLPPLLIKSLSPQIQLPQSDQDQKIRARM